MFDINEELELLSIDTGIPLSRINELYVDTSSYEGYREYVACYGIQILKSREYLYKESGIDQTESNHGESDKKIILKMIDSNKNY